MAKYYYSTQPFLAWCLNHYFYGGIHYVWVGAPFYPHHTKNPRSSNPMRIYEDLYDPWKEKDAISGVFKQKRLNILSGVTANSRNLQSGVASRLTKICDDIDLVFFYPIVYRVDIDTITSSRLNIAGSGLVGSNEYRIDALREGEFEVLFDDFETETDIPQDFRDLYSELFSADEALSLLEKWIR